MKNFLLIIVALMLLIPAVAQPPQKLSYQSVVRNADGKLLQNTVVGLRFSILEGSPAGTVVYAETHVASTNVNGLVTAEIGTGSTSGNFAAINWSDGPYYLKSETDPVGGTSYTISGVSELLSVPFALNALTVGPNGFSGNYNDLTNKPVTDGSETKIQAGSNITVSGSGTQVSPYVINAPGNGGGLTTPITLTTSQIWTVPASVSKIKVELWGGAGGGGGAGAYSYSYNLNNGGDGGSGGYVRQEMNVTPNQQFNVFIGNGGGPGTNAVYIYPGYYYDTDGSSGGDTWFGSYKAAGGAGGKRGSYSTSTVHGNAGTNNLGTITGYADPSQSSILNVFTGLDRSYLNDRVLTSKSGKGGMISGYSSKIPTGGEGGAAVITLFE